MENKLDINLNKIWVNPFSTNNFEIKPPFEKVKNTDDIDFLNSNFVIDYNLFMINIQFNPLIKVENFDNKIMLYITREYPPIMNVYYSNGKGIKQKGYHINTIDKTLGFIVEKIERKKLKSEELQVNKKIKKISKNHKFVVNFGKMQLNNQINDDILIEDNPEILNQIKENLNIYNKIFMEYIANPAKYPYYEITDESIELNFNNMR